MSAPSSSPFSPFTISVLTAKDINIKAFYTIVLQKSTTPRASTKAPPTTQQHLISPLDQSSLCS